MTPSRKAAGLLMAGAEKLIPPAKQEWARAMTAETAHLPGDAAACRFAAGCVRAALTERMRSLAPDESWSRPGAAIGALLVGHALIPGSGTWPLLWPLVGGALAVLASVGGRHNASFSGALATAFKAGLLGGVLLIAGASLFLLAGDDQLMGAKLTRIAIAAVIAACLATIGGAAVAPLVSAPPAFADPGSAEEE